MIETFTKTEFEAALPKSNNYPVQYAGLIQREHCYYLNINEKARIFIRSSVDHTGISAGAGEDSIRTFLVDNSGRPLGSKIIKYTTRKPGWDERLKANCRYLIRLHKAAGLDADNNPRPILKVKGGENKGRFFSPEGKGVKWSWLTNSKGEIL